MYKDHDYRLGIREKEVARWRRGVGVVFAGWTGETEGIGKEVEIWEGGVRAVVESVAEQGDEEER